MCCMQLDGYHMNTKGPSRICLKNILGQRKEEEHGLNKARLGSGIDVG